MNLGNIKLLSRAQNPGAKSNVVSDTLLELIINNGVFDINAEVGCLKTNDTIKAIAEQREYDLSSVLTNYVTMDRPGIWWYNSSKWEQLDPVTLKHLDERFRNWRDRTSSDPQRYSIDGYTLTLDPKPDTTVEDGIWIYYIKAPETMTESSHFPFSGSTTEIPNLKIFDTAILAYVKWQLSPILNKGQENLNFKKLYEVEREKQASIFNRRMDLSAVAKMRNMRPC